jgi:glycosyltransferase involved in cell wall biosynthesis
MNSGKELISVLMPAYNCEKFIKQAIDSILNQTYSNFELLIADDCSNDNTKKIIDSYTDPRIKTFHNAENLGYLKASNKLFALCKGEYITFQDADDYAAPARMEKLLNYLNTNPDVDCVGSNTNKVDEHGEEFYKTNFPQSDAEIRQQFVNYRIVMTGSALMLRKKVIDKVGIYNEYFDRIGSEDSYWYSYILDHYKVANLAEALYYYRANPDSLGAKHTNPKAFVGHQLIVELYNNRKKNKPDFIATKNWKQADDCARYLMAINKTRSSFFGSVGSFLNAAIKAPGLLPMFSRQFLSNLRSARTNKE